MPLEEYSLIHGRVHVHESRADCYLLVLKHFVLYSPHPPPLLLGVLLILVPRPHVNIRKRPLLPDYWAGPGNETMGLTEGLDRKGGRGEGGKEGRERGREGDEGRERGREGRRGERGREEER